MSVLPEYLNFKSHLSFLAPVFKLMFGRRSAGVRTPGKGVARAAARLADHRKAFAQVDLTPIPSRQQRRAEERAWMKRVRSDRKAIALQSGDIGGAAACR